MTARRNAEGRVTLVCDGCSKEHTVRSFGANKARTTAGNRGWAVGDRFHRVDYCPACKGWAA